MKHKAIAKLCGKSLSHSSTRLGRPKSRRNQQKRAKFNNRYKSEINVID